MQRALGSSFCAAVRRLTSSATPGLYGKPPFSVAAMLMNSREICRSLQFAPQFQRFSQLHMPLMSGFPAAARGDGADRSGLPAAVRGTPGVGYSSHWAEQTSGSAANIIAAHSGRHLVLM